MLLSKHYDLLRRALLVFSSAGMLIGSASAQQSVMVAGDSISAGYLRPSYRLPLLDSLGAYGCPVSMVGDQSLNNFDYRDPQVPGNGDNYPGFSSGDGYDVDHQAFPAITTDQFGNGVSSSYYTVNPISSYIGSTQPDFVMLHLGSNDMGADLQIGRLSNDAEV